ncbi:MULTISPECIES: transcription elongation factor GreA [Limnochorda]|uniref:transcription elongation factor GreA n=1 Tax=Limnochorda TaxID=1676651 RepID=UPI0017E7167F|nr:transcription elongation factor GreA [Limnochorda pilosa]MBO2485833.1 transcription elongation factor GreA [Bacillota bacterium]MBO2519229.1 transcription elongation factor GreA [Bacillota bacterium]NMA71678.1 transcription elongation factor GreA [Bacillota bacterium]
MSDQQEILLTKEGLARLESELEMLKTQKRREVAERIKAARELGDISENSEYDDAKNEQAFIEGRIAALEKTLRRARVVSMDEADAGVVVLGSRVRVRDLELGEEMEYRVVGSAEADPTENRISNESPVGKALMGQRAGTVVTVKVPDGTIQLEILEVLNE